MFHHRASGRRGLADAGSQRIAEANAPLEHVIAPWTVSPHAADHIAAIRRLIERGATHVLVHSPQRHQRRVIEFYGSEVLPGLG